MGKRIIRAQLVGLLGSDGKKRWEVHFFLYKKWTCMNPAWIEYSRKIDAVRRGVNIAIDLGLSVRWEEYDKE